MERNLFYVVVALMGVAAVGYVLWLDRKKMRMLRLRVKKLHASALFAALTPLLRTAQNHPIEELTVDKTGLTLRYMQPVGAETRFDLRENGFSYMSPEKQEALLYLLEEFLPRITDTHRYCLHRRRTWLLNGQSEIYYQYTIQSAYKNSLVRAPYYDGTRTKLSFPIW